jgi:hypothetical protein
LKRECHSKTAARLKECSPKASRSISRVSVADLPSFLTKHFKSFGSGFTELHAKLDADTLLDFAIRRRQNETRSRKSTRVKTMLVHMAE